MFGIYFLIYFYNRINLGRHKSAKVPQNWLRLKLKSIYIHKKTLFLKSTSNMAWKKESENKVIKL